MILVRPLTISDNMLTSSVAEPDSAAGEIEWTTGTYALGTRRVVLSTHSIYEVVADPSTSDSPLVGIEKTPATWVRVGATNKYKMFDQSNSTATTQDNLSVDIVPVELVNSVSCFNAYATSVTVKAFDPSDTEIYTNTIELITRPNVVDWYTFYYAGFSGADKFVLLDIPPTTLGRINISFDGEASVGTCVIGSQFQIGETQYGTGAQLLDFSDIEEDQFGNISYTEGFVAELVDFDILVDTGQLDSIFSKFKTLKKQNAVFVGNPSSIGDSTLAYGFVRDYSQAYTWPTKSKISLTVRGVV